MARRPDQWALVGALSEPQRRAVYEAVADEPQPVTREHVADTARISRSLAAFHLDKLVAAGLLEVDHQPSADRRQRKIGRPAKRYRRSARNIDLTLPARRYDLAGRILARAVAASEFGEAPFDAARRLAREEGLALADSAAGATASADGVDPLTSIERALDGLGYAPTRSGDRLTLGNCPFHLIVSTAPRVTCAVNLALLEGLLLGLELDHDIAAALQPQPGLCCVTLARVDVA
ncbi:MAG: helix-turn-helix domain-containing protein [Nocardioidaceae bacterium]